MHHAKHRIANGLKAQNVIAQGQRGTSASLGMRPPQDHEPCKGGIFCGNGVSVPKALINNERGTGELGGRRQKGTES